MTSISAKNPDRNTAALRLVFVVYPEISLLDLAGPLQAMMWAKRPGSDTPAYAISIVSRDGGIVPSDSLLSIETEAMDALGETPIDTLIVVGGDGVYAAAQDAGLLDKLERLVARAGRVCSVCSAAYLLAALGLLEGRRAVTHWEDSARLQQDFPGVQVEEDPIYIQDGAIWTSAGVTAGIDMALAIVAQDLGHEAALSRAQALVTYMVRPGGQSQFSPVLKRQCLDRAGQFEALHRWMADNLTGDLGVSRLAEQANMSERSFHRAYRAATGLSPAKAVESMRVEYARDLLETTEMRAKTVARRSGFASEDHMRRSFLRCLGVSPTIYKERFQHA